MINGPKVGGGAGTRPRLGRRGCEGIREERRVMDVGTPGTAAAAAQEEEEEVMRVAAARPLWPRGGLRG